jgi:hypothetical protein
MDDGGVGIVNPNGQAQCDETIGCLAFCTVCQDEEVHSLPPTPQPTVQLTTTPTTASRKRQAGGSAPIFAAGALVGLCILASCKFARYFLVVFKRSRDADQPGGEDDMEGTEFRLLRPLADNLRWPSTAAAVDTDGVAAECGSSNGDAAATAANEEQHTQNDRVSLSWSAMWSSPAPIFAIDRDMQIISWSQGACAS